MALQNFNSHLQDHPDVDRHSFYSTYGTQASTNMVTSRQFTPEPNKYLESACYNNENIQNSMLSNHLVSFDQRLTLHATATYPYSGLTSNFEHPAAPTNGNYPSLSDGISQIPSYPQEGFAQYFSHYPQVNFDSYREPTSHLTDGTNMKHRSSMDVANQVTFIQNPLSTHYIHHSPQKGFLQDRIPCIPKTESLDVTPNSLPDGFVQKFDISTLKKELGTTCPGSEMIDSFTENKFDPAGPHQVKPSHLCTQNQTTGVRSGDFIQKLSHMEAGNESSSHLRCETTLDSPNSAYAQNEMHLSNHNRDFLPCPPINEFDVASPDSDIKPDIAGLLFQELALYLDEQKHTPDLPPQEFVQKCSPRSNDDVKPSSAELTKELASYLDYQNRPLSEGLVQKFSPQSLKNDFGATFPHHELLPDYKDDTHQQTSTFVPDKFTQKFTPPIAENEFIGRSYPYCAFSPISEDDYDASHYVDQRPTPGIVPTEFIPNHSPRLLRNEHFETPVSVDAFEGQHASQINVPSSTQGSLPGAFIQKFSPRSPKIEFETTCEDPTIYSNINSHLEIENQSSGFSREEFIQKTSLPLSGDEFRTRMSHSFRTLTPDYPEASYVQGANQSTSPNERICASRFYHALTPDSIDASTNPATSTFLLENFHKKEISFSPIDEALDMTIAPRNMSLHDADSANSTTTSQFTNQKQDIENITPAENPTISKNENIIPKRRPNRSELQKVCKKIRPTVSRNINKIANPPIDVQKPSSPNGENNDFRTSPKESESIIDQIEALIRTPMEDYMTHLAAKEERFVEEMLAENPVIEKRRFSAKSVPESSSSAKDQLRRKRAEVCRKSRFNVKVRRTKMEFRHAFITMELKQSSSLLNSVKETIDELEAHLRSQGYSEEALQSIRDKAGFDQTSFAKSHELSKKWIGNVDD